MPGRYSTPQGRLRLTGAIILVAGLVAAVLVYFTAANGADRDAVGYEVVGGHAYAVKPEASARELQELERFGGKAAVVTFEFRLWFASLWQGERLAYTLAALATAVAVLCLRIASLMAEAEDTDA